MTQKSVALDVNYQLQQHIIRYQMTKFCVDTHYDNHNLNPYMPKDLRQSPIQSTQILRDCG